MWGWLTAIVQGLVRGLWEPLMARWAAEKAGREQQRAADLEVARSQERAVQEAVEKVRREHPMVDDEWLRAGEPPSGRVNLPAPPPAPPASTDPGRRAS
jgi:hypothetical protein